MTDMRNDPPWSHVRDTTVKNLIKANRDALEKEEDPLKAAELRGRIFALRDLDKVVNPAQGDPTLSNDVYNTAEN